MYPITIPQFNYVGARRPGPDHAGQGPLDCLGHGVLWNEELLPSQSVSIAANASQESASVTWNAIRERLAGQCAGTQTQIDVERCALRGQSSKCSPPAGFVRPPIRSSRPRCGIGS